MCSVTRVTDSFPQKKRNGTSCLTVQTLFLPAHCLVLGLVMAVVTLHCSGGSYSFWRVEGFLSRSSFWIQPWLCDCSSPHTRASNVVWLMFWFVVWGFSLSTSMLLFQASCACFDISKKGREESSGINSQISLETNYFPDLREYKWVILFFLLSALKIKQIKRCHL